ncbi:hydrogenase formation protein HypD, partial [Aliarcobacter butzleri]|nr:hydrogenase formation protein HypD [Aliarcobacter butzleri]
MEKELQLKDLYDGFRDSKVIKAYKKLIDEDLKDYDKTINIMEVCGGHTHTIMKYG